MEQIKLFYEIDHCYNKIDQCYAQLTQRALSGGATFRLAPSGSVRRRTDTPKKLDGRRTDIRAADLKWPHGRPCGQFNCPCGHFNCPCGRTDVRAAPDGRRTDAGRTLCICRTDFRYQSTRISIPAHKNLRTFTN